MAASHQVRRDGSSITRSVVARRIASWSRLTGGRKPASGRRSTSIRSAGSYPARRIHPLHARRGGEEPRQVGAALEPEW
ncbi:MAG: hypothetical protein ACKOWG_05105, partial [Planctomycetia bacterium]